MSELMKIKKNVLTTYFTAEMGYKRTKYNICQPFMKENNCDVTTKMLEKKIEKFSRLCRKT